MRVLAVVLLPVLVAAVVWGIVYVPRHDGRLIDFAVAILLPTAGVCWCLWQLVSRPGEGSEASKGGTR